MAPCISNSKYRSRRQCGEVIRWLAAIRRRPVSLICRPLPLFPTKNLIEMPIALLLSSPTKNHHIELSFVPAAAGDPPIFPGHECGRRQERLRQVQPVRCRPVLPPPQSQVSHPPNGEFFFGVVLAFVDVHLVMCCATSPQKASPGVIAGTYVIVHALMVRRRYLWAAVVIRSQHVYSEPCFRGGPSAYMYLACPHVIGDARVEARPWGRRPRASVYSQLPYVGVIGAWRSHFAHLGYLPVGVSDHLLVPKVKNGKQ